MPDTRLPKAKNNESGTFGATLAAVTTSSATVTPVPEHAPGVIVARPGTAFEEHIFYAKRDAVAGTVSGLIRDYTNLNGGVGREHLNGAAWETLQSSLYLNNLVDALQEGFQREMQSAVRVDADTFTIETNRTAYYTKGRMLRFNQDQTYIGFVISSSYNAGSGLTTVEIGFTTIPATLTSVEYDNRPKGYTDMEIGFYAEDAGGDDTYEVTLSPAPRAYWTGMRINLKVTTGNTGTATLNVNGLGAKTIKTNVVDDLEDGTLVAGQIVPLVYDGTNFQIIGGGGGGGGGTTMVETFVIPGVLSAGNDMSKTWYPPFDVKILSADLRLKNAGASTGSTIVDINVNGVTKFTTKPTITGTNTSDTDNAADSPTATITRGAAVTIDVDSVTATPPVEAYVDVFYEQA